jgi:hypothetical protein
MADEPDINAKIPEITPSDWMRAAEISFQSAKQGAGFDSSGNYDPGYCGLGFETGPRDPWWKIMCQRHDRSFNELKAGTYKGSGLQVAGRAAMDVLGGMLAGAYLVVSGPLYFIGAVGGGILRWGQLERRAGTSYRKLPEEE